MNLESGIGGVEGKTRKVDSASLEDGLIFMLEQYIKLAVSKAATDVELAALHPITAVASELDEQERTFEARINASKAARGEGPTKVSKAKQQELDQFASDAKKMAAEQLNEFAALDNAWAIIFALHMGLDSDTRFWSKAHLNAHPSDAAIVREFAIAKTKLRDALAAYLDQFPDNQG